MPLEKLTPRTLEIDRRDLPTSVGRGPVCADTPQEHTLLPARATFPLRIRSHDWYSIALIVFSRFPLTHSPAPCPAQQADARGKDRLAERGTPEPPLPPVRGGARPCRRWPNFGARSDI